MRKIRKAIAGLALAATIAIPTTLTVAAPAEARPTGGDIIIHNQREFNNAHSGRFRVKIGTEWGKSARIYVGANPLKWKPVSRTGWVEFLVGRERLRNHTPTTITVKVYRNHRTLYVKRYQVVDTPRPALTIGQKVANVAKAQVGKRYVFGADGPRSFDCSGLMKFAYAWYGIRIPHGSSAQRGIGRKVSWASRRPGDILWTPGHVSMYIGDGKVVEAATPRTGVRIARVWQRNPEVIRVRG